MSRKLKLALLIINTLVILWLIWSYLHGSTLSIAITPANLLVYVTRKKYPHLSAFILLSTVAMGILATHVPTSLSIFSGPITPIAPPINTTKP
jgi:hypothetical protein